MLTLARLVDGALEAPVVPSFTRIGYDVRSRVAAWSDLGSYALEGRTVLITGATSGLGLAAAEQIAHCGATVVVLGRDESKTRRVLDELHQKTGNDKLSSVIADLGRLDSVREAASEVQVQPRSTRRVDPQCGHPERRTSARRRHRGHGGQPGRGPVPVHGPAAAAAACDQAPAGC